MEVIIGVMILAVVGIFFGAVLSRQLTDEFEAWTQWIINHLVNRAVRRLAEEDRSRFEEEWLAHVNEIHGKVDKIIAALGFLSSARRISSAISVVKRILDAFGFVLAARKISRDVGSESRSNPFAETTKRLVDIGIGIAVVWLMLPLLFSAWFAVRCDSPGPAFVFDEKVGMNGRLIWLPRFRTRSCEAASDWEPDSASLKKSTRVGQILWNLYIDTLPYLISVLRGDLSLVGPSPKSPQYMENLCRICPDYQQIISVRPGLMGWAQAHFAYFRPGLTGCARAQFAYYYGLDDTNFLSDTNIVKMADYDLYYVKNRSFMMDVGILVWTLSIMFMPRRKQLS